uniref:CCDC174 alpha/beta GRSR domain-containing protein n=1 Tax=Glossina morsitans morsitans TaxID=37546 RepID=A0A1B0G6U3_GLOMM
MNDPNKVINVNLSSLLSLKVELLRKQAEVNKAKALQTDDCKRKGVEKVCDDDGLTQRRHNKTRVEKMINKKENPTVIEHEDSALLEKSRKVLEAKAKFYERMNASGGTLNSDDNCLVLFNKKKQEKDSKAHVDDQQSFGVLDATSSESEEDNDETVDSENEWVEYTDCLGRTRKCLRKDLESAKKQDADLAASIPERLDQTKANWMINTLANENATKDGDSDGDMSTIGPLPPQSVFGDGCSMMSKHEEQKVNWERKEQENLEKKDVHYQDVFFDEARQHGVGYYAFSTDEEERRRQQKELEKTREQTIEEQERREALRARREKIIAERVFAAKNRQRARLGLPPLEANAELEKEQTEPKETKEERKLRKRAKKLAKKQEKEEREREYERQHHIRPWDRNKDGVPKNLVINQPQDEKWSYKPEREPMTQEQWNEYKRSERIQEFAPPIEVPLKRKSFSSMSSTVPPRPPPSFSSNSISPHNEDIETFINYQSTKKSPKYFKKRNYINDENEAEDSPSTSSKANLEGELHYKAKKTKSSENLEQSIEAGLRFLRNNYDKQMPACKSTWTAKADY